MERRQWQPTRLSFVLAPQELAPIHKDQFAIYSAIQANTDIKIAFAVQQGAKL